MPLCALANDPYHQYLKAAQSDVDAIAYSELGSLDMNIVGSWIEDAQFRFNTGMPANNADIKKMHYPMKSGLNQRHGGKEQ
jgi:hypothetical protein